MLYAPAELGKYFACHLESIHRSDTTTSGIFIYLDSNIRNLIQLLPKRLSIKDHVQELVMTTPKHPVSRPKYVLIITSV